MTGIVPSQRAAEAAAIASAWIAQSPNMITVLAWHKSLCPECRSGHGFCDERREIIAEYGASEFGTSVFFPAPD